MDTLLIQVIQYLPPAVIAAAGAVWAARGAIADQDRRISVLETQLKAQTDALAEIRSDLRELRTALLGERRK